MPQNIFLRLTVNLKYVCRHFKGFNLILSFTNFSRFKHAVFSSHNVLNSHCIIIQLKVYHSSLATSSGLVERSFLFLKN